jgi:hypothetical protein
MRTPNRKFTQQTGPTGTAGAGATSPASPTGTTSIHEVGPTASTNNSFPLEMPATHNKMRDAEKVEAAVYSYIRAIRTLGNTRVNSGDIARALGLTVSKVNEVLPKLNEKGVKQVG